MQRLNTEQIEILRAIPASASPNRVRAALGLLGTTQSQAAQDTGINASTLSQIVNGKHENVTLPTARALATYCGCLIEDLFPARAA